MSLRPKRTKAKKRGPSTDSSLHTSISIPTKVKIKQDFITEAKKIWSADIIDQIDFEVEIVKRRNMMGLVASSRPKAIDDVIIHTPKKQRLRISPEALNIPREKFLQFLRHEALHIGHSRHDWQFRELAKKHNIPLTEIHFEDAGFKIQAKEGSRYKTIVVEESLEEAKRKALQMREDGEERKLRVIY